MFRSVYLLILTLCLALASSDPQAKAVVYPGGSWCKTARCVTTEPVGKGWWVLTAELRGENLLSWRKDVVVFREGDEFENRQASFVRTKVARTSDLSSSDVAATIVQQELTQEVARTKLELLEIKKKLNEKSGSSGLFLLGMVTSVILASLNVWLWFGVVFLCIISLEG